MPAPLLTFLLTVPEHIGCSILWVPGQQQFAEIRAMIPNANQMDEVLRRPTSNSSPADVELIEVLGKIRTILHDERLAGHIPKDHDAFRRYLNLRHDMSTDELLVLDYLKRFPNTFTDASQICKQASTQHRYATEPQWARLALQSLEADGHLETDKFGHYRIAPALLAKYIEHFRGAQRVARGCTAVDKRIMKMAPEDDEKTFNALLREALSSNHANEVA